ncbi:hypothetical protein MRX96_027054 [Rhipicephalus microplus]
MRCPAATVIRPPQKLRDTEKSSTGMSKGFLGYEEVASGQKPELYSLTICGDVVKMTRAPLVHEKNSACYSFGDRGRLVRGGCPTVERLAQAPASGGVRTLRSSR